MWVVAGEEDIFRGVDHLEQLEELPGAVGFLDGLGREIDVFADVFAGEFFEPGSLGAQGFVVFIHAPEERREPSQAAFDGDKFQRGEFFEDALADEGVDVPHEIQRDDIVPLKVAGGAAGGGGIAGGAGALGAGVNRDGEAVLGGGFVERMEKTLAEEAGRTAGHEDLDETFVGRAAVNLFRSSGGVGVVDDNGAAKSG